MTAVCCAGEACEALQQLLQRRWLGQSLAARHSFTEAAMKVLAVLYRRSAAMAAGMLCVPAMVIDQVRVTVNA